MQLISVKYSICFCWFYSPLTESEAQLKSVLYHQPKQTHAVKEDEITAGEAGLCTRQAVAGTAALKADLGGTGIC